MYIYKENEYKFLDQIMEKIVIDEKEKNKDYEISIDWLTIDFFDNKINYRVNHKNYMAMERKMAQFTKF
jgi:hypothetical protein